MKKLYNHYFPTPSYLAMNSFSFDISSEFIRYGQLIRTSFGLSLEHFGEQKLPNDIIFDGVIKNEEKLIVILKNLRIRENIYFVRVALPNDLDITIKQYLHIFKSAGFFPLSFELSTQALARAIIAENESKPFIIIDFGETSITLSIVNNKQVIFSTDINSNDISFIGDEIDKQYINWKKKNGNTVKGQINHILLCGKYANMDGLLEYMTIQMKMKVEYANVWVNISDMKTAVPKMHFEESLAYGKVIGLALEDYFIEKKSKFNLLPTIEKKLINKEYKFRLLNIKFNLLSFLGVIAILLILPSYLFSTARSNMAEKQLEIFNDENQEFVTHSFDNNIQDINSKLNLLSYFGSDQTNGNIFNKLLSNKPIGITFSNIVWKNNDNNLSFEIAGKAKDVNSFNKFKSTLIKNPDIDLTDSSIVKIQDGLNFISFTMKMTIK